MTNNKYILLFSCCYFRICLKMNKDKTISKNRRISIKRFRWKFLHLYKNTSTWNSTKRICHWNCYSSRRIRFISINLCFSNHLHLTMRITIAREFAYMLLICTQYWSLKLVFALPWIIKIFATLLRIIKYIKNSYATNKK